MLFFSLGWSKGLGADLTERIEDMLDPTDIFDIKGPSSSREQYPIANDNQRSRYAACSNMSMVDESLARLHESSPRLPLLVTRQQITEHFPIVFSPLDIIISSLLNQITARSWDTSRPLCAIPHMKLIVLSLSTRSFLWVPEVKMW